MKVKTLGQGRKASVKNRFFDVAQVYSGVFNYLPATIYIKKELHNNRENAAKKPKEKLRGL